MRTLTKDELKIAERLGRWLRKHNGHRVERLDDPEAVLYVCRSCDKALATSATTENVALEPRRAAAADFPTVR